MSLEEAIDAVSERLVSVRDDLLAMRTRVAGLFGTESPLYFDLNFNMTEVDWANRELLNAWYEHTASPPRKEA